MSDQVTHGLDRANEAEKTSGVADFAGGNKVLGFFQAVYNVLRHGDIPKTDNKIEKTELSEDDAKSQEIKDEVSKDTAVHPLDKKNEKSVIEQEREKLKLEDTSIKTEQTKSGGSSEKKKGGGLFKAKDKQMSVNLYIMDDIGGADNEYKLALIKKLQETGLRVKDNAKGAFFYGKEVDKALEVIKQFEKDNPDMPELNVKIEKIDKTISEQIQSRNAKFVAARKAEEKEFIKRETDVPGRVSDNLELDRKQTANVKDFLNKEGATFSAILNQANDLKAEGARAPDGKPPIEEAQGKKTGK